MKFRFEILLLFLSHFSYSQTNVLVLDGNYTGKNIYIQNPFNESGDGFCTVEVKVNGIKMLQSTNSSAYVIPLDSFNFKLNDSIRIEIFHQNNCSPRVLQPELINPLPTFVVTAIDVDSTDILSWTTKNETGKLLYTIEQFIWNKWIVVGEMGGLGNSFENKYEFKLTPHSGTNKIRVKQSGAGGKTEVSKAVVFESKLPVVKIKSYSVKDKLEFTSLTRYEVYDEPGNMVKKGYGREVNCENLKNGTYYVNFDNSDGQIIVYRKK